jgi:hypothetical protein
MQDMKDQSWLKESWPSKPILILILLALLSCIPAALSLNREVGLVTFSGLELRAGEFKKKQNNEKPVLPAEARNITPEVQPLDILPLQIEGYLTGARHKVAGENTIAEAYYEPDTEQAKQLSPYNCYVRISYLPSTQEAEKSIELSLDRYPVGKKRLRLGDLSATESYESSQQGYFIGWTAKNYAIEVDTSFTRGKHPGAVNHLVGSGREVAASVDKFVREKLK